MNPDASDQNKAKGKVRPSMFNWSVLFGFDIFISYRRKDAAVYAGELYRRLQGDFLCFLDDHESPPGTPLKSSINRALDRSRVLLLIATSDVLSSEWVPAEVERFGRSGRPIIPLSLQGALTTQNMEGTPFAVLRRTDVIWIDEDPEITPKDFPSDKVVGNIQRLFVWRRARRNIQVAVAAIILALLGFSIYSFIQKRAADANAQEARSQRTAAELAARRAENEARIAQSRALAAQSLNTLEQNPEMALHLAYQAVEVTFSVDGTVTPEAEAALHSVVGPYQTVGIGSGGGNIESIKPQAACLSADGKTAATRNLYESITMWDVAGAKVIGFLAGHHGGVSALSFSPDGRYLASAGNDKKVKLWDWRTGKEIRHYFGHTATPTDLVFSQDGKKLLSWEQLRAIVWDVQTGKVLGEQDHPWGMPARFYPDGSRIAFVPENSGEPMIWNFSSGEIVNTSLESGLTQGGTELAAAPLKRELRAWKRLTGLMHPMPIHGPQWGVSDDLQFFAMAPLDSSKVLGLRSFDIVNRMHTVLSLLSQNNPGRVSFTGHGKYLYWIDGSKLRLYEISTGQEFPIPEDLADVKGAWSNDDGEMLTITTSGEVDAWRPQDNQVMQVSRPQGRMSMGTRSFPSNQVVQLSRLDYRQVPDPGDLIGFDGDDRLAILPRDVEDSAKLRPLILYSVNSGKTTVQGISKSVFADTVSCCFEGKFFYGNRENGRLYPLNKVVPSKIGGGLSTTSDGSMSSRMVGDEVRILNTASDREMARFVFPAGFGGVGNAFIDSRGTEVVVSSWQSPSPAFVSRVKANRWTVPPYGSGLPSRVWDGGCWIPVFHLQEASFSSDGHKVAVATGSTVNTPEQASIWDTQRCQELAVLPRLGSAIAKLAFFRADSRLILGTSDGLVTFWDLGSNSPVFSLGLSPADENTIIADFDVSRDGRYIAIKTNEAIEIHLLRIPDLLGFAMTQVTRPLTDRECHDYLHVATCPQYGQKEANAVTPYLP